MPYAEIGTQQLTSYVSSSQLPYNVPGLVYWLDPERYADAVGGWQLNGSKVSVASSRESGAGQIDTSKNGAQTTDAQRPTLNAGDSTLGGKNTLSFVRASTQFISGSTWNSAVAQPWTVYAVAAAQTGSNQRNIMSSPNSIFHVNASSNITLYAGVNLSGSAVVADNIPRVFCGVANGASSTVYVNDSNIPEASGNASAGNVSYVGIGGLSTSNNFDGTIGTVLLYQGAHDAATRAQVMDWLRKRYGLDDSRVPYMLPGLVFWLDPERYADWTLNDTKVATAISHHAWNGARNTALNVTQATDANRPTLNVADSAFNGRNSLSFSYAAAQILRSATLTAAIAAPQTVYAVALSTGTTADTHRLTNFDAAGAANKGSLYQAITTGLGVARGSSNLVNSTTNVSDGVARVYCGVFNGASSGLYLSNATTGWTGTTGSDSFDSISIGGLVSSQTWDGKIATVLVYSGAHTAAQRSLVMGWLGNRYGITVGGL